MDDMQALPKGTEGTVVDVDDIGSVLMKWEQHKPASWERQVRDNRVSRKEPLCTEHGGSILLLLSVRIPDNAL